MKISKWCEILKVVSVKTDFYDLGKPEDLELFGLVSDLIVDNSSVHVILKVQVFWNAFPYIVHYLLKVWGW